MALAASIENDEYSELLDLDSFEIVHKSSDNICENYTSGVQKKWKEKRESNFSFTRSTEEIWSKTIDRLSNSDELQEKFDCFVKILLGEPLALEFSNPEQNEENFKLKVTRLMEYWKKKNPKIGTIQNLLGYLRLVEHNTTADSICSLLIDDEKSVQFDISRPNTNLNFFVGRRKEMVELYIRIMKQKSEEDNSNPAGNIFLITGPFGIGKSEFVRYFSIKFTEVFDGNLIWISAESYNFMKRAFIELAKTLGICILDATNKERELALIVQDCYKHFQWTQSLFIFDNAVEYGGDNGVKSFLPTQINLALSFKPYILITSRNRNFKHTIQKIEIGPLEEKDAIDWLEKEFRGIQPPYEEIKMLSTELGCFTLLIKHASAYIRYQFNRMDLLGTTSMESPITQYINKYRREDLQVSAELLSRNVEFHSEDFHSMSLLKSFKIILDDLLQLEATPMDSTKLKILGLIAFGPANHLPKLLFSDSSMGAESDIENILILLEEQNIIFSRGSFFTAHRGVQKLIRVILDENGKQILMKLASNLCKYLQPRENDLDHIEIMRNFLPTIESINNYLFNFNIIYNNEEFDYNISECAYRLWHCYSILDQRQESYDYANFVLDKFSSVWKENDKPIIMAKYCLAHSLADLNLVGKAKEILEPIFVTSRTFLGISDPLTLKIGCELGWMYNRLLLMDSARQIYDEVYEFSHLNPENICYTIRARWQNANLQKCDGDPSCIPIFEAVFEQCNKHLGPTHLETLRVQHYYSKALFELEVSDFDKAFEILNSLIEILGRKLGLNHQGTAVAYIDLTELLISKERYEEAKSTIEKIFPYLEKIMDENDLRFLRARERRGVIDRKLSLITVDEELEIELENLNRKLNGLQLSKTKTPVIHTKNIIADLYYEKGDLDKSLEYMNEVFEAQKIAWKENHKFTKGSKAKIENIIQEMSEMQINVSINEPKDNTQKPWECERCCTFFKCRKTLNQHFREIHKEGTPLPRYPCVKECGKVFNCRYERRRHIKEGKKHSLLYGNCQEILDEDEQAKKQSK